MIGPTIFSVKSTKFENFQGIPYRFSDVSSSQYLRRVCSKCSGLLLSC